METDEDYLSAAASSLSYAKFGAFFIPGIGSRDSIAMAVGLGMHFIRIGYEVGEIDVARPYVDYAKELGLEVSLNPMKSYAVAASEFGRIAARVDGWQSVDTICIVDSAGSLNMSTLHVRVVIWP